MAKRRPTVDLTTHEDWIRQRSDDAVEAEEERSLIDALIRWLSSSGDKGDN